MEDLVVFVGKQQKRIYVELQRLILLCLAIGGCTTQSALGKEPSPAQTRAGLYEAKTASVLQRRHWNVTLNRSGKLVADQSYEPKIGFFGPGAYSIQLARLTIEFTAETSGHTKCHALIVGYGHRREVHEDKLGFKTYSSVLAGPFPLDTSDYTKEIQNIMEEAEKQLIGEHPEFATR